MASPRVRAAIFVGMFSIAVLGIVWAVVFFSLQKQQMIAGIESPQPPSQIPPLQAPPAQPSPEVVQPKVHSPLPSSSINKKPRKSRQSTAAKEPIQSSPGITPEPHTPPPGNSPPDDEALVDQGMSPNCMAELERLCPHTEPGSERRKCVQDNEHKLLQSCRRQLDAMATRIKEDMQRFKVACEGDVRRFCRRMQPGGGVILQCLEEHYQEVSDPCYQALRIRPFRR